MKKKVKVKINKDRISLSDYGMPIGTMEKKSLT